MFRMVSSISAATDPHRLEGLDWRPLLCPCRVRGCAQSEALSACVRGRPLGSRRGLHLSSSPVCLFLDEGKMPADRGQNPRKETNTNARSLQARISILAPNSLTQYTHRGIPTHFFSLAGSRDSGQGPVCPNASPEAADRGLPMRFCQTPHRPWWLWIDFSAVTVSLSCRKGQPSYPPYPSPEQPSCQMTLRQKQPIIPGMLHQPSAGLNQPLLQTCQRPVSKPPRQCQSSPSDSVNLLWPTSML